jgi:hypothetical protein
MEEPMTRAIRCVRRLPTAALVAVVLSASAGCAFTAGVARFNDIRFRVPGTSGPGDIPIRTGVPLRGDVTALRFGPGPDHPSEIVLGAATTILRYSELTLFDFEFTWRVFPAPWRAFRPYVGAGGGYYRFGWTDTFSTCPPGYYCFPGHDEDFEDSVRTTLASGFNPHVVAGANVPWKNNWWWVVEGHYEVAKETGADFSGPELLFGVRWKPPPGWWK